MFNNVWTICYQHFRYARDEGTRSLWKYGKSTKLQGATYQKAVNFRVAAFRTSDSRAMKNVEHSRRNAGVACRSLFSKLSGVHVPESDTRAGGFLC
jgi:hypothetical protein